jgi:hypothetical protein
MKGTKDFLFIFYFWLFFSILWLQVIGQPSFEFNIRRKKKILLHSQSTLSDKNILIIEFFFLYKEFVKLEK